jgi:hypothetical protein
VARIDLVDVGTTLTDRAAVVNVRIGQHPVPAQVPAGERHAKGDRAWLTFERSHVFDRASGSPGTTRAWAGSGRRP